MEETIEKVRRVQKILFEACSSDDSNEIGYDDLSMLSDVSSIASIHLEKFDIPEESSENSEPEEEQKHEKIQEQKFSEEESFQEIPPNPPVRYRPIYGIPTKLRNMLVPDISQYSSATVLILKGRDFPKTKSGVRSTYVTFQYAHKLPIVSTPICYNHEDDAFYNGGYSFSIKEAENEEAFPMIQVYDVISSTHQDLIGFNVIQFQRARKTDNYLTVVENEWIPIFMPHSRRKAGFVLVSLYLHNGDSPVLPKEQKSVSFSPKPAQKSNTGVEKLHIGSNKENEEEKNVKLAQNNKQNETKSIKKAVNDESDQYKEKQSENDTLNDSSRPVKSSVTNPTEEILSTKNQNSNFDEDFASTTQTRKEEQPNSFLPEKSKSKIQSCVFTGNEREQEENNENIVIKPDFNFTVDETGLVDSLKLDVSHHFSWSELNRKQRIIRFIDTEDLDLSDSPPKEETETQTENPTHDQLTQTQSNHKPSSFKPSNVLETPPKEYKTAVIEKKDEKAKTMDSDGIPFDLFSHDEKLVCYSDFGLFSRRNFK